MSELPINVLSIIKSKLESFKCPVHGNSPEVTITPTGFSMDCCCSEFEATLMAKHDSISQEAVFEATLSQINNL